MVTSEKLKQFVNANRSVHKKSSSEQTIEVQVQIVRTAIDSIFTIIANSSWSWQELESKLWVISTFFREQKFVPVVLPVLEILAKEDIDLWKDAKQWDTQMLLTPKSFENLPKSVAEIKPDWGVMETQAQLSRELHLLSIYLNTHILNLKKDHHITENSVDILANIVIWNTLRVLAKKIKP